MTMGDGGKMEHISAKIIQLRKEKNLSTNKLAKLSGLSQSFMRDIEIGKSQPTIDTLSRICSVFGITLSDFFNTNNEQNEINNLSSEFDLLKIHTKDLRPFQQNTIKNILSIASNVAEDYKLFNQLYDKSKSNYPNKPFIEILDLLDRKDTPLSVGGYPLSMEDRIAILEFLRDRVLPDEEAAGDSSDMVIAANYQGDRFTQNLTPENLEDIENAIKFAEEQERNKKHKK